jgi:hypothetical protein
MTSSMKRFGPYALSVAGLIALFALLPRFNTAQPRGARLTRAQAVAIADKAARQIGVPVERAWSNIVWVRSRLLDKEMQNDPERRRRAENDPVLGPRLGRYQVTYYRRGADKSTSYGYVEVSAQTGEVLGVRLRRPAEEKGSAPTEQELRARADAFVASRSFPGAPSPRFEQARPTVMRSRTDWVFRYRVQSSIPTGNVVPYLHVFFVGNQFAGWMLVDEYADGHAYREDNLTDVAVTFIRFIAMFVVLLMLLVMFLRKYHAGEVGVGTGSFLFAVSIVQSILFSALIVASASEGTSMGSIDAQQTALTLFGFFMLFLHVPVAVCVFLGWSVGESYARERWGERLASFDALLRRDALNATVGRSVLRGLLVSPAVAAAAFLVAAIPLALGIAHPSLGAGSENILYLGGALSNVLCAAFDSVVFPVVAILFVLAFTSRRRALPIGILASIFLCTLGATLADLPLDPIVPKMVFGFGGVAAAVAIFLAYDLLSTAVAMFGATLLTTMLPLLSVARGDLFQQLLLALLLPLVVGAAFAIAALMSRREVIYTYEDLAPHVKRIVERERVKAEIDAANRIQAALLPVESPLLAGATVASHYRAATEIGGDYFDFLPQPGGEIGIAFGDVSGHGLTSGIVMAMAKAALLVQVEYDPSPRAVLNMLNEVVMKTAPRRILMTFFFGLLDPRSQRLRFSSAGHLDPYVYRSATGRLESLSSWGFPLGVKRRDPFREHEVEFSAGDRLILYSDGLIEAVDDDGEPYGFERFERTLMESGHMTAEEIKKTLLGSVRKFTRNRPPDDDQTLVVVSFDEEVSDSLAAARVVAATVSETVH